MPRYILIDGTSYIYRAFFGMPPLTSPSNAPVGAIYGVVNMIKKLEARYPKDKIIVVFDPKGPTARNKIFPAYKANRSESPADLISQINPTIELISAFGWPTVVVPGVEADDVIGTLALQAKNDGFDVLISTADKDFAQLVQPGIAIINTMTNKILDYDGVVGKFGVKPEQIIDYLALIGDTSDNIPGIPKVGPKTAVKWLSQWPSITEIIANIDQITGKVGQNLQDNLENLHLYKALVTIDTRIPISLDAIKSVGDTIKLQSMLTEFGFKTWLNQVSGMPAKNQPPNLIVINTKASWYLVYKQFIQAEFYALYCNINDPILNIVIVVAHKTYHVCWQNIDVEVKRALLDFFKSKIMVSYDCKNQLKILKKYGIELTKAPFDILLAAYVLNDVKQNYDLSNLSLHYLGFHSDFSNLDSSFKQSHAAAWLSYLLYQKISKLMENNDELKNIFYKMDLPLIMVLLDMESTGVLLDVKNLEQQSKALELEISALESKTYNLLDCEFNLNSPKQLRKVLFENLGLKVIKKTAAGEVSTAEDVLQKLSDEHAVIKVILQHRHLSKLQNTYCSKLAKQVDKNNRIHCTYNQAVTSTGRLSATQPNLQNIPIKTIEGRKIRQAFIAAPGYKLISADYNQIELRVMAHFSQDDTLCKALLSGEDIHTSIAAKIFNCASVSLEQRRQAKIVNFGLIYGMSAFGLAEQLGIDNNKARDLVEHYFTKFPGVKRYLEDTRNFAIEQGYVKTILGRKIITPEATGRLQAAVLRSAVNAPIQGSAAELIKCAMISLHSAILKFDAKIIMQVHDELVLEVADKDVNEVKVITKNIMENIFKLSVPLKVAIGFGQNWQEAH